MSFSSSGYSSQTSEINVTPLIDVLLVLLIIFMVLVPLNPNGLKTLLPQQPAARDAPPVPDLTTIVLRVQSHSGGEPSYTINQHSVAKAEIVARLTEIFALRQQRVMYVEGDAGLEFSSIAEVIGFGHQARVDSIGVLTPGTERRE